MPGKKQLKQFSKNVLDLGDEVKVRALRGEKPAVYDIPENISDADDSQDFVIGMPEQQDRDDKEKDGESPVSEINNSASGDEISGVDIPVIPIPGQDIAAGPSDIPDLDEILSSVSEPKKQATEPVPTPVSEIPENIADMDLDALPGDLDDKTSSFDDLQEAADISEMPLESTAALDDEKPIESIQPEKQSEQNSEQGGYDPNADFEDDNDGSGGDIDLTNDLPKSVKEDFVPGRQFDIDDDEPSESEGLGADSIDDVSDFSEPEEVSLDADVPLEAPVTEETALNDSFAEEAALNNSFAEEAAINDSLDEEPPAMDAPVIDESEKVDFQAVDTASDGESGQSPSFMDENLAATFDADNDFPQMPDINDTAIQLDEGTSDGEDSGDIDSQPIEAFDTSEIDNLDFTPTAGSGAEKPSDDGSGFDDFDIKETDAQLDAGNSDFELGVGDDFTIPGFSDTDEVDFKNLTPPSSEPDVSTQTVKTSGGPKVKNTLTEVEYERFKKNLASYPLNLRIAIEDLIVKNEFTDDTIFEIIQKVLKKQSARQLASHIEKLLDISLPVPRDFEHRTVAEYEIYKSTLEYQLKNRIIPIALISFGCAFILFFLFLVGRQYIYRPIKADSLYRQGYSLLEEDEYEHADRDFKDAVTYRASKSWFFKYARAYREHKQYERSSLIYDDILKRFNNDKNAGLEYADMTWRDLSDYSGAVRIINDRMLLYHVNDKDGLLKLGDIYLDWGDNGDIEKYENARENYASLISLYGENDVYLSRMMRYFIRKDNLAEVLRLKEVFFPRKKSLGSDDLTDLSGYMFDKSNSTLAPAEQYLRERISDVKELMERAIRANPKNPTALYNMARYFIQMSDQAKAIDFLDASQQAFAASEPLKTAETYRWVDSYRLEGEIYTDQQEILKAAETFTNGISLFKNRTPALPGNSIIGRLYGDMADIDYFKYNNSDSAYSYYKAAIENDNDTPSIRYKIGAILYEKNQFPEALGSFITTEEIVPHDNNLLMALGNVLVQRNSYNAAKGYYEELLSRLDLEKADRGLLMPQVEPDDAHLVEMYMKASNNLGVSLYNLAKRTGNSNLNGQALVRLSESLRAWDALTRNQETMRRLPGINLAEQNIQYVSKPMPNFEPAIYPDIPRTLDGEKGLK